MFASIHLIYNASRFKDVALQPTLGVQRVGLEQVLAGEVPENGDALSSKSGGKSTVITRH